LHIEDANTAAEHFVWLALGVPLDRGMFISPAPDDDLDDIADSAVKAFLAAYR